MYSIIIPTLNEIDNIDATILSLNNNLKGLEFEIIFVDDNSTDGTYQYCQKLAKSNSNVRMLLRIGKRGLSSAVFYGMMASRYDVIIVLDADLQYDLLNLKLACETHVSKNFDVTIMARDMIKVRSSSNLSFYRKHLTYLSRIIISFFLNYKLTDPNSGFFIINKTIVIQNYLMFSQIGFKILLDILLSCKNLSINEFETVFLPRKYGESKLTVVIFVDLFEMMVDKISNGYIQGKFLLFVLCGAMGLSIQLVILQFFQGQMGQFEISLLISSILAAYINYLLNNNITFREKKIKRLLHGKMIAYMFICVIGMFINNYIVNMFIIKNTLPIFLGLFIGGLWNYFMSKNFVWRIS